MKNMMMDENHFVVSYELLQLLEWMISHEQDALKKIVAHASTHGFVPTIPVSNNAPDLRQSAFDFFALLETLMVEVAHEQEMNQHKTRMMIPAVDHIDSRLHDLRSLAASIDKAERAVGTTKSKKADERSKAIFCKELLRRWKPAKKALLH